MDKSILLQKQVRDNSEDLQNEFLDMKNWEERMQKADREINKSSGEHILPPVRGKKKAPKDTSKPQNKESSRNSKRIKSCDYSAWEKFDVNKACEEVEKSDSDDDDKERPHTEEELEKKHAEATVHKDEGNRLVKAGKWTEAVGSYSKAIKIFPHDAIFFANRALCHLKIDNIHSAEADCTAAIQLDELYVKAYHRRATARIAMKQYEEAARDINKVLKLDPSNKEAKAMLVRVNKSIAGKKPVLVSSSRDPIDESGIDKKIGEKLWDSSTSKRKTDEEESAAKGAQKKNPVAKEVEVKTAKRVQETKKQESEIESAEKLPDWLPEVHENYEIVKAITKSPHQRSKKPLRTVPVQVIDFSSKSETSTDSSTEKSKNSPVGESNLSSLSLEPESEHIEIPEAPKSAAQFLLTWRKHKSSEFRHKYFKQLPAERMASLFQDSLESDTFSEILSTFKLEFTKREEPIFDYLKYLSEVKRFRTLTMFMSKSEKKDLQELFDYCKTVEGQPDHVVKDLRDKYEI